MSIQVQIRRGTANQHSTFTGALGELTYDTTNKTLRIHDATTVGGHILAKLEDLEFLSVGSNIVPNANNVYDLGTPESRWKDIYLSGNTIYLGGTNISRNGNGSIRFIDGANNTVGIEVSSIISTNNTGITFANVSITNLILQNVLGTEYGGTGLDSFTAGGVLYASDAAHLSFATGSAGEILQLNANGMPSFDKLDGGSYS